MNTNERHTQRGRHSVRTVIGTFKLLWRRVSHRAGWCSFFGCDLRRLQDKTRCVSADYQFFWSKISINEAEQLFHLPTPWKKLKLWNTSAAVSFFEWLTLSPVIPDLNCTESWSFRLKIYALFITQVLVRFPQSFMILFVVGFFFWGPFPFAVLFRAHSVTRRRMCWSLALMNFRNVTHWTQSNVVHMRRATKRWSS